MNLANDFILFLKRPTIEYPVSLSFKHSIWLITKSIPFFVFFVITCFIIIFPISVLDLVPEMPIRELPKSFWIIGIGPVLEELIFRLPLKNYFKNCFISIALLLFALLRSRIGLPVSLSIALFVVVLPHLKIVKENFEVRFNQFISNNYHVYFYMLTISFGLLHITNFQSLTFVHYLLSPFLVFYQILLGLFLGFVRVNYKEGMIYCILIHSLFNSFSILIKLI